MLGPTCSVCQNLYNEDERLPLSLQCGHGFCKACLSRMFSASPDNSLSCPRCRHVSFVGNSVTALTRIFPVLETINAKDEEYEEDNDEDEDDPVLEEGGCFSNHYSTHDTGRDEVLDDDVARRRRRGAYAASSCAGSGRILLGMHSGGLKLVRRIEEDGGGKSGSCRRVGVEVWTAILGGAGVGSGRCRHKVSVKKVPVGEGMDVGWVQGQLEGLVRASMWCRNVCAFHGMIKMEDGSFGLVMDRCRGSVQTEMRKNEGRLTLEQILRYGADIARGVAELHAAGVVCMNIKPSNLLLDLNGHAVIADYGLPAILKRPACRKTRPECGSFREHSCMDCTMLSPNYTAPEAWEPIKKSLNFLWDDAIGISQESDAWSFGCTLVEMCTGSVPWAGLSAEEIYRAVVRTRKQPPQYTSVVGVGIPRDLWKMIGECLQFKALKRPSFSDMLKIFLRHLQEIPRSPPASPENEVAKFSATNGTAQVSSGNLKVCQSDHVALLQLLSEGNVNGVRSLLSETASGPNVNSLSSLLEAQNADGQTALHLACRRGSVELVEAILEHREANVDILDKDGDPPLVFALAAGSPECVRALVQRNADVRSILREGLGPSVAHVCAYHGHPDCMRELLLAGADPNAIDDEGESVLHRAVAKKYTECAIVILENGGCKSMGIMNSKGLTPLHLCVMTWNVAIVERWMELASSREIADAIDIPSPAGTVLCMAAALKKGHEDAGRKLVRILLAAGADPASQETQHGRTALHTAAMINDVELVKVILDAGVDVNIRNLRNTIPLHVALARGAKSCVELLLSARANCNLQDDDGDNAFHIAADTGKMIRENLHWIIHMLTDPDAAVDVKNHSGKTLRDYLESIPREWISEDLMEALLEKGVQLSPTIYQVGDWVKFKRSVTVPSHGWQGAQHKSVGFVQNVLDHDHLVVSFCSGEAQVLASEVLKVIPLDRGQHVQLKPEVKEPRFGWRGHSRDTIGTVLCVDDDGILRVGFPGASRGWKADPAEMERVEEYKVGDWVRIRPSLTTAKHGLGSVSPGSIGVVLWIRPDNSLLLELCYLPTPWHCEPEEVESVEPFKVGDRVCVKRSVAEPRYAWGGETHHSVGVVRDIESDGLLIIEIPNRPVPWQADPSDMEKVEDFKVGDWVRIKASVSSPKYGWEDVNRNSIGVIHSLEEDGDVGIAFCFRKKLNLFCCSVADVESVSPYEVGQEIHVMPSVTEPRLGWSNETPATIGKIARIDMNGALNVKVAGRQDLWKLSPGDAERLSGFEVGDWVRSKPSLGVRPSYDWNSIGKESLAVVHSIQETGYLELACCFRKGKWITHFTDVEKVPGFKIGQHVRFRSGIVEPRWGWRGAQSDSRGVITRVNADGEVRVVFFGLQGLWRGDPADLEVEHLFEVGDWVKLQESSCSWKSVGPGSVGVIHSSGCDDSNELDGSVSVAFCGEQDLWIGHPRHLRKVDKIMVGQKVKIKSSVRHPRFGWSGHNHGSVGTITSIDGDGKLRIYTPAGSKAWALDPSEVTIVEEEDFRIGDWLRVKSSVSHPAYEWADVCHSSIGVLHRIDNEYLCVAFCFMEKLWLCKPWEVEKVRPFKVEDKVRIKEGLVTPRWGWGMETPASKGKLVGVDANGKLRIRFQWREGRPWTGDPADIVLDQCSSD